MAETATPTRRVGELLTVASGEEATLAMSAASLIVSHTLKIEEFGEQSVEAKGARETISIIQDQARAEGYYDDAVVLISEILTQLDKA